MSTLTHAERLSMFADMLDRSSNFDTSTLREIAEVLSARLTPPAEVVRYRTGAWGKVSPDPEGEWVRYEDHAAALASERATRIEAESSRDVFKAALQKIAETAKHVPTNGRWHRFVVNSALSALSLPNPGDAASRSPSHDPC